MCIRDREEGAGRGNSLSGFDGGRVGTLLVSGRERCAEEWGWEWACCALGGEVEEGREEK